VRVSFQGSYELAGRFADIPILIAVSIVTFLFYEETLRRWLRGSRWASSAKQATVESR
jgi:peptidoglycan/LPS O-acetylase OafA/YrhL